MVSVGGELGAGSGVAAGSAARKVAARARMQKAIAPEKSRHNLVCFVIMAVLAPFYLTTPGTHRHFASNLLQFSNVNPSRASDRWPIPRVVLLIESSRASGRSLLRGIADYARLHGPWAFYWEPGGLEKAWPQLEYLRADGIILR